MTGARRFLPSISSLRALEALDRLGSATAVAEELDQTQSAVSRQLQTLEAQLGTDLILRERRQMRLTPAASDYAATVREALDMIAKASMRLQVSPDSGALSLAILPTFGMRWLVPRLAEFAKQHPEIAINIATRLKPADLNGEGFDAAIYFGSGDWPGLASMRLKREQVLPVCAPDLLGTKTLAHPRDLLDLPLLHIETRPTAWRDWFAGYGITAPAARGMLYDQFATITQAALHGLGVALLPDYLAEQDIATGRLVPAYGPARDSLGSYYFVWPKENARNRALDVFRDWLATQAQDEDPLPR